MSPADGISKLGFRRWYERQLIESHAYLVTGFLCLILIAASFEGLTLREASMQSLTTLATMFVAGAIGLAALKRYIDVLARAEHIAEHSMCPSCSAQGRLQIVGSGMERESSEDASGSWMRVQCRKCGHQWMIE